MKVGAVLGAGRDQAGFLANLSFLIYRCGMNGKQVIAKLVAAGWTLARIEGNHHILEKVGMSRPVPVPVHGKKDLGAGLLAAIQRQSGVKLT